MVFDQGLSKVATSRTMLAWDPPTSISSGMGWGGMQPVPLIKDRIWNSSALQASGEVPSPSAASQFPNHPVPFLSLRLRTRFLALAEVPGLLSSSSTALPASGHPLFQLCGVSAVPQTVPFHGAVPLFSPVAPPGLNVALWASTGQ